MRFSRPAGVLLLALALASALSVRGTTNPGTETLWLSGRDAATAVPWDFFCTAGRNSGQWVKLPVPSNWDALGYGTLNYGRDETSAPVEQGRYHHRFDAPAAWTGRRVFLVFDGVMTDTAATLNGQPVGPKHQGGFYPFRYDVTALLRLGGKNLLEVTVNKFSANASVNRAERQSDYWVFGGIHRPVRLEALPAAFIARVAIDARADGAFMADVTLDGAATTDSAEVELFGPEDKSTGLVARAAVGTGPVRLATRLAGPLTWTAETPRLYTAEFRLKRGEETLHRVRQRFGFRTVEVRPTEGIFVNGRRVILQGVNRHSFNAESGRALSEADHRRDIALMQGMNMNAVRMSHYPPDARFLELCDELGLYVLDELGGWQQGYDTATGRRLVEEMVTRDVNHPSILFWDNGNEGGWNTALDAEFARWDPQRRLVLHPWDTFSGVNTAHYLTYDETALAAKGGSTRRVEGPSGKKRYEASSEPAVFLPTEFLHGLYDGGIGAGFEDYWKTMTSGPSLGGGFFWVFADEGVKRPDTGQIDVFGNRAPDGIVGPYHQREASAATVQEIWSPLVIRERELPADFTGKLTVENHYSFTDASACRFHWELRRYPAAGSPGGATVLASGTAPAPAVAPGSTGQLPLQLPADWRAAHALALRIDDPRGRELWTWVWPLARPAPAPAPAGLPAATFAEDSAKITLRAGSFSAQFDKASGHLIAIKQGARTCALAAGPRPAAGQASLTALAAQPDGPGVILTARYTGDLTEVRWRLSPEGTLTCDYRYTAEGPRKFLGVVFDLPGAAVRAKRWLGDGPYRVWQNRRRGVTHGLWENTFNATMTGHSGWDYPEFQGCFANVRWMELQTDAGPLVLEPLTPGLFVQVLSPEFPSEELTRGARADLPAAGLGLLHAIPAIGNKFHRAEQTGPQGRPFQAHGEYRGSFRIRF